MKTPQSALQENVEILTLKRLRVISENGEEILISSFWESSPVVFIFIRHFGCMACRAHVDQVWKRKDELQKNGAKIIFIGNGQYQMIKVFKEEFGVKDAQIYTDPSLKTFDAAGMVRGVLHLINPKGLLGVTKMMKNGYSQGKQQSANGVHTQLGGVMAIKSPGIVTYHFVSEYFGDFDQPEEWV